MYGGGENDLSSSRGDRLISGAHMFFNRPAIHARGDASRPQRSLCLAAAALVLLAGSAMPVRAASDPVVATVGTHEITQKELDAKIKPRLEALRRQFDSQVYDLKSQALDSMTKEYVVEEAAKKENLSVDDYFKRHTESKKVTEADAKKYYDDHKELSARYPKYDEIKGKLVDALQQQHDQEQRQALVDKLTKEAGVKVLLKAPRMVVKSEGHPELGPKTAPVTIVEFSDFQCPYCKRAEPTLKEVREKYGDKVRLVYMDFPLGFHQHAMDAAMAGRCAEEQGKFWPMHDEMFTDQAKLSREDLMKSAGKVGLDAAKFDQCLKSGKYHDGIAADQAQGQSLGVDGTPAFFVNGRALTGAQPFPAFAEVIDQELANKNSPQKQARAN